MGITLSAQTTYTGTLTDTDNDPIIGATIMIDGTTTGTITDIDGNFSLSAPEGSTLKISYIGFNTMYLTTTDANLGQIAMESSSVGLEEVVVTGTMDIVRDRRTPVAVSTISLKEIQSKGGNVEFPDLLKATPSIYVANQAGGYGDSEVFTRGFDQTNTAFLLNGQPINGMEDGKMYWSNWSGMSDVASAIQVQRGLGSSKLAISSVGGTTNIIMKSTDKKQGGNASFMYGNDNYMKATVQYNSGLINDKFGISALFTHWQGDGWADGTKGSGQNYFLSMGYNPTPNHKLNFLITGAPQKHDQNFSKKLNSYFRGPNNELDVKFNDNWGSLNGEYYTLRANYYHKPVANLNWDWKLNEKSSLNTVVYASWGRGGSFGPIENSRKRDWQIVNENRFDDGQINFDGIVQYNKDQEGSEEFVMRNSVNNHSWYGLVTRYDLDINENFDFSIGADLRTYHGSHFRQINDLLGASAYTQRGSTRYPERDVTAVFDGNPWKALTSFAKEDEKIAYANDETISYGGLFSQVEYNNDRLSAFVQGALSTQSHTRFELFNATEENEKSETVNNPGFNIKGGASFNLDQDANHVVFFNTGYYSRQPFHDNIYLNFSNQVNPLTKNENLVGVELGYKLQVEDFSANINLYKTNWSNRVLTRTLRGNDTINNVAVSAGDFENIDNITQDHTGIELDGRYRINDMFTVKGFASIGNWIYTQNAKANYYKENDRSLLVSVPNVELKDIHVGGSAQTSAGLGLNITPIDRLNIDVDAFYYDRLYANAGLSDTDLELPSYALVDLGASYNLPILNNKSLTFRVNVYNLFGTEYISKSRTAIAADADAANNWNGINKNNVVTFGTTRTWNASVKFYF